MNRDPHKLLITILSLCLFSPSLLLAHTSSAVEYQKASEGLRLLRSEASGSLLKILVEKENLGSGEVEIAELSIPAGTESQGHTHGSIEFFYILSGEMEHIVNGESYLLKPGMIGIVRPGDTVVHKIPESGPCKTLVIWVPGGEVERLKKIFTEQPGQ